MIQRREEVVVEDAVLLSLVGEQDSTNSRTIVIVFSSANASSFTFYKLTRGLKVDIIYVRDPFLNKWFQHGYRNDGSIDDFTKILRDLTTQYSRVITFGSSMGGFAAIFFGIKLEAWYVYSICPQISLDPLLSRSPRKSVQSSIKNLIPALKDRSDVRIKIIYGEVDEQDIYNIALLYTSLDDFCNINTYCFAGQDHMLPKQISDKIGIDKLLGNIISENFNYDLHFFEFIPDYLSDSSVANAVIKLIRLYYGKEYKAYRETLGQYKLDEELPVVLDFLDYRSAMILGVTGQAQMIFDLAERFISAIDIQYEAALACLGLNDSESAAKYLRRVVQIRSSYADAKILLHKLVQIPG